jgi:hypothetical protein
LIDRVLLEKSSGFPLKATLKEIMQQQPEGQGAGLGYYNAWLADAAEWDRYTRVEDPQKLLMYLLRSGGWAELLAVGKKG